MITAEEGFPKDSPFRKHFPSEDDIRYLCEQYGIGDLVTIHGLLGGFLNVNLKIKTTKGLYVLRILSGYGTLEHILYVENVVQKLREAGVPALVPLISKDGLPYTRLHDRFVMITPFVKGRVFQHRPKQARSSGAMLRKFHDALVGLGRGPAPAWSNYPSESVLSEGLDRLRRIRDISAEDLERAELLHAAVMQSWRVLRDNLPETVIHGDWHLGNQLYTDGNVKCILDFDFVQWAERIHDVAYAVWSLLIQRESEHLVKAFLNGYGSLMDIEVRALPLAIARAAVFFVCTASFTVHPGEELRAQLARESPLIEYLLSKEGAAEIHTLCSSSRAAA